MIILYIIGGLVALFLLAALLTGKVMKASRNIVINKPAAEVFNYIKYLKNQDNFSKWAGMDPAMKKDYRGTDGTVGFVSSWNGNKKVGQGEQEITGIEEGKQVNFEIRFLRPFKSQARSTMSTEPVDNDSTKVTWGFQSRMPYPFNIFRLLMNMDKKIGDDFSTGLNNLKALLEKP